MAKGFGWINISGPVPFHRLILKCVTDFISKSCTMGLSSSVVADLNKVSYVPWFILLRSFPYSFVSVPNIFKIYNLHLNPYLKVSFQKKPNTRLKGVPISHFQSVSFSFFKILVLAVSHGKWDLSSPTRNWTHNPCIWCTESQLLDH